MTAASSIARRGQARREAILAVAAELFARNGYAAVGMDDIGSAAGVTGPAIYRHFGGKAAVLAAVFDRIIDAVDGVDPTDTVDGVDPSGTADGVDPTDTVDGVGGVDQPVFDAGEIPAVDDLRSHLRTYAAGVSSRRSLMAVFVREVHHLPPEHAERLRRRQRNLVRHWRLLLAEIHPEWSVERVRTAVHGVFGMLNAVGTFDSPLTDGELAEQLVELSAAAMALPAG